jgi:hypothetical protein
MSSVFALLFDNFSPNFNSKFGPNIDDPNTKLRLCVMYYRHWKDIYI